MKIKRILAALIAAVIFFTGQGWPNAFPSEVMAQEETTDREKQNMLLWYKTPADINTAESNNGKWMQESLALGNGDLGNLIFGGIKRERIHFNEKSLWTGGPSSSRPGYQFGNTDRPYTAEEIQAYREVLDDKSENVFNDTHGIGMGAAIRFPGANTHKGSYQDFGDIWLDFTAMGIENNQAENYRRELNLHTGIAATEFEHQGTSYYREHFVSSPDQVMVTRLTSSGNGRLSFSVLMELNNSGLTGAVTMDGQQLTSTITGAVQDNGLRFQTTLKVIPEGGNARTENNQIIVENADAVTLIMAAATDYKNDYPVYRDEELNLDALVMGRVNQAAEKSYEELKNNHIADHGSMFDRVSINLGEDESHIPTNELVQKYRNGEYSNYLDALAFQFGRYLTIAGSRGNLPSNLVGLWTVGASAWTGDYHFNVNV